MHVGIKTKLFKHQEECFEIIKDKPYYALFMDCGTGKTLIALTVIAYKKIKHKQYRTLIVCPNTITENWLQEVNTHTHLQATILSGSRKRRLTHLSYEKDIFIINYEGVSSIKQDLINKRFDYLILDECFSGETVIETRCGDKKIKNVRVGDEVKNCLGWRKVVGTHLKKLDHWLKITYNGKTVKCSINHPFLTTEGWKHAKDIKEGDSLISTESSSKIVSGMWKEVLSVRENNSRKKDVLRDTDEKKILREVLFSEMENETARDTEESVLLSCTRKGCQNYAKNVFGKSRIEKKEFREDAEKQPYERSQDTFQSITNITENEMETCSTGRKWKIAPNTTKQIVKNTWENMAFRIQCVIRKTKNWISYTLQNRHCECTKQNCDRGRRKLPQSNMPKRTGQKENEDVKVFRVDCVTFHKRANNDGCRTRSEENLFYDLTITGHPSFSVNEALVHNSHFVKSVKSLRSKACYILSQNISDKLLLTGTPVMNNPLDIYAQYRCLNPTIFGNSFYRFRAFYAVMGGYGGYQVMKWINMGVFRRLVFTCAIRKTKEECLDLPAQLYQTVKVSMPDEQKAVYKQLKHAFIAQYKDVSVVAPVVLTRLIRFSQITAGFTKDVEGVEHAFTDNPKISWLIDFIANLDVSKQLIVFCRFRKEIDMVERAFIKEGITFISVHGETTERLDKINRFNNDPSIRIFITNTATGGVGVNLTAATYAIFLTNGYSYGNRIQAEDRIHRIGQDKNVTYIDVLMEHSIDSGIYTILKHKQSLVNMVMKDVIKTL